MFLLKMSIYGGWLKRGILLKITVSMMYYTCKEPYCHQFNIHDCFHSTKIMNENVARRRSSVIFPYVISYAM